MAFIEKNGRKNNCKCEITRFIPFHFCNYVFFDIWIESKMIFEILFFLFSANRKNISLKMQIKNSYAIKEISLIYNNNSLML